MVSLFDLLRFEVWLIAVVSMRGVLNIIHSWILFDFCLISRILSSTMLKLMTKDLINTIVSLGLSRLNIACRTNAQKSGVRRRWIRIHSRMFRGGRGKILIEEDKFTKDKINMFFSVLVVVSNILVSFHVAFDSNT